MPPSSLQHGSGRSSQSCIPVNAPAVATHGVQLFSEAHLSPATQKFEFLCLEIVVANVLLETVCTSKCVPILLPSLFGTVNVRHCGLSATDAQGLY